MRKNYCFKTKLERTQTNHMNKCGQTSQGVFDDHPWVQITCFHKKHHELLYLHMISLALVNEHGLLLLHRRKGNCIYCIAAISGDVFAQMRCAKTTARDTTLWFMLCFSNQTDPKKVHSKFMRVQSLNMFAYHDSTGVGRGHISTSSFFFCAKLLQ